MLKKMFKMMKRGNKGFTLVELMVVVVIIGVLTAIAVPVYNNVTAKAKINAIAANLRIINGAISQKQTNGEAFSDIPVVGDLIPDYIQASLDENPKGVTYTLAGDPLHGVATVGDDADIKGLTAGSSYTLSDVQDIINNPGS